MSGVPVERLPDEADEIAGHIRRGEVYTAHLDALGERILPGLAAEIRRLRGELGTVLGQLATVKEGYDAQALTERQRLARALADRNDEYDALKAEFDQFAEVCASHSADRCVEQVAAEDLQAAYDRLGDQAQRIVEAASRFRGERDRLYDAMEHVLLGPWESNGAGDVRSPWIPTGEVEGWRRLLADTPRSERDGEPQSATGPSWAPGDAYSGPVAPATLSVESESFGGEIGALRPAGDVEPCAHCGKPRNGLGEIGGIRVCHTGKNPAQFDPIDCYRLVTVYGEPLGARISRSGAEGPQESSDALPAVPGHPGAERSPGASSGDRTGRPSPAGGE